MVQLSFYKVGRQRGGGGSFEDDHLLLLLLCMSELGRAPTLTSLGRGRNGRPEHGCDGDALLRASRGCMVWLRRVQLRVHSPIKSIIWSLSRHLVLSRMTILQPVSKACSLHFPAKLLAQSGWAPCSIPRQERSSGPIIWGHWPIMGPSRATDEAGMSSRPAAGRV